MNTSIKSKMFAAVFALGLATPLTLTQSIVMATPAEAGVLGSIKSAAKSVGGAVKSSAKAVGGATVTAATAVGGAAKTAGVGLAGAAKGGAAFGAQIGRGFERAGKQIYYSAPGRAVSGYVREQGRRAGL